MNIRLMSAGAVIALGLSAGATAAMDPMVGGAAMQAGDGARRQGREGLVGRGEYGERAGAFERRYEAGSFDRGDEGRVVSRIDGVLHC
jgi:hypothetical protein